MISKTNLILCAAVTAALCGCRSSPVLVFGQSHSVGISIGGAASESGAELTLGYKDRDIAIVPVAIVPNEGATLKEAKLVNSSVRSAAGAGQDTDALSVLGQFEVSAKGKDADVGLGKFFATGLAAQKLADGFACKLGDPAKCSQGMPSANIEPVTPTAAR
jgi:hypothetical protein